VVFTIYGPNSVSGGCLRTWGYHVYISCALRFTVDAREFDLRPVSLIWSSRISTVVQIQELYISPVSEMRCRHGARESTSPCKNC